MSSSDWVIDARPDPTPGLPTMVVVAIRVAFVVSILFSLWAASVGWGNPILDLHAFRQTQTAITAYYLMQGGPFWRYETPVFGPPWSIPFELPLYQALVALLAGRLGTPLDQTGRFVSEFFFYATLLPAYRILRNLGVRMDEILVFLALFLVSPQYLFWSRTFMIESTALFLGMAYLALASEFLSRRKAWLAAVGALVGILGALVKITTFLGFQAGTAILLGGAIWKDRKMALPLGSLGVGCLLMVPFLGGAAWTRWTDGIKAANPLAEFVLSRSLNGWNFGTFEQRLGPLWSTIFGRTLNDALGAFPLLLAAAGLVLWRRTHLGPFATSIALFLGDMLVFTNLHIVHNCYAYANSVFVIAAVGWTVTALLRGTSEQRVMGLVLFLCGLALGMTSYTLRYLPDQRRVDPNPIGVATVVRAGTRSDDVILVYGADWNPSIPYYARRRAVMDRETRDLDSPEMSQAIRNLGKHRIGALVTCGDTRQDVGAIGVAIGRFGLEPQGKDVANCKVFFASGADR